MTDDAVVVKKKSPTKKISQPHDHLVKKLLSNSATAKDILKLYLPEKILNLVDLNFLNLQRDSFIDDEHRIFEVEEKIQNDYQFLWFTP